MIYDIIPIIIIILALAVTIFILLRKVPQLSSFEAENTLEEKQKKVKKYLLENRLDRKIEDFGRNLGGYLRPLTGKFIRAIEKWIKDFKDKISKAEEKYNRVRKRTIRAKPGLAQEKAKLLIGEAYDLLEQENFNEAEKNYIEAISYDHQNVLAYRGLGKLYIATKEFKEARESFEHVAKLIARGAGKTELNDFISLGLIYAEIGEPKRALNNFKKAWKLEPDNPKNLDFLCAASIIAKDKETAKKAYEGLKRVNPENQKLGEFEEEIKKL